MIREDYLLRQIHQLVKLLLETRKQREERRLDDALDRLDQASRSVLGLDSQVLARMAHRSRVAILSHHGELDLGKAVAFGMLLQERAAILSLQGQLDDAEAARVASVALWLEFVARAPLAGEARETDPVVVDQQLVDDLAHLAEGMDEGRLPQNLREQLAEVRGVAGGEGPA